MHDIILCLILILRLELWLVRRKAEENANMSHDDIQTTTENDRFSEKSLLL